MLDEKKIMQLIYDIKIELGFLSSTKLVWIRRSCMLYAVAVFLLKAVVVDAAAADNYD